MLEETNLGQSPNRGREVLEFGGGSPTLGREAPETEGKPEPRKRSAQNWGRSPKREKKPKKNEEAGEDSAKKKAPKTEVGADADDLTKVEGIGPKIAEIFQNSGIHTYSDLAEKTEEELKEILTDAGAKYASKNPASWPKQAKMASKGQWDELEEWQESVKGGIEE